MSTFPLIPTSDTPLSKELEKAYVDYLEHFYPGYRRLLGIKENELTTEKTPTSETPLPKELEKAFVDYLEHFYPGYSNGGQRSLQ